MQFILIGRDGHDEGAAERRQKAREPHLQHIRDTRSNILMGAAMLNEQGDMTGSVMTLEFENREALDAWLADEPYVQDKVWATVEIIPCKVPPLFRS